MGTAIETKTNQSKTENQLEYEYVISHYSCDENGNVISFTRPKTTGSVCTSGYLCFGKYFVHRIVWILNNGEIPDGFLVDHINRDKLDNRLENLRLATYSQNRANSKPKLDRKFKGVNQYGNGFYSYIVKDKRVNYLGAYSSEIEAAKSYNAAAIILHGEFARLNDIEAAGE